MFTFEQLPLRRNPLNQLVNRFKNQNVNMDSEFSSCKHTE